MPVNSSPHRSIFTGQLYWSIFLVNLAGQLYWSILRVNVTGQMYHEDEIEAEVADGHVIGPGLLVHVVDLTI
jgi:hypothetical protein